jgi:heme/copper-type cytochrome/quinol oxidase subunit 2
MLYAICFALVLAVMAIAIPNDVWRLLLENSRDLNSRLRARYVWQESKAVGNFFAGFLLGVFVLTILLIGLTIAYDFLFVEGDEVKVPVAEGSESLWNVIPIAIVLIFGIVAVAIRLTARGYALAMDKLVVDAAARNRRKIAKNYLLNTAQSNNDRWHRVDEGKERS